jgi:molybdopterin-guanine dinucleotide biosynthesis protein B
MKIMAFTGSSNSGKTTLISKIVEKMNETYKITVIKNDPKDKAIFDQEGKDSDIFFKTGADVVVTSSKRTTFFSHQRNNFKQILNMIDSDFVFVEGLKYLELPRICVVRDQIDNSYFDYSKAVAIKNIDKNLIPKELDILELDNIDSIIAWIYKNAIEVEHI